MEIQLTGIGKRYGLEWIFRKLDYRFESGFSYALTGHNGSGKSTLLKIISGGLTVSEGNVIFKKNEQSLSQIEVASEVAYVAPYIFLIEQFTLREMLKFHLRFKKMNVKSMDELIDILDLKAHLNKPISHFSSGMMQRLKLCLAILSDTEILLLDEPTSYLDAKAIDWYRDLLNNHIQNRLVLIGSNKTNEYNFVTGGVIHLPDYKYTRKNSYGTQL